MSSKQHSFGGSWTEIKLKVLKDYMIAYKTALKNQKFKTVYIDAFAGTGEREMNSDLQDDQEELALFDATRTVFRGSASLALDLDFDEYIFIERNAEYAAQLEELRGRYHSPQCIHIINGEANREVQRICTARDWNRRGDVWRGVMFLDPYGMQMDWRTMEVIAGTHALDVWLLVPLGVAINRVLTNSGELRPGWSDSLDRFFGTHDWYNAAYEHHAVEQPSLFGGPATELRRQTIENIEQFFLNRLDTIFEYVHRNPVHLCNQQGRWIYSFCFMMSSTNERAHEIGGRIANHLVRNLSR
jgi:three-Cys-motif partner protein